MNGSANMKKGDERKIILVELTNHCNFACTLCPHAYYGKETPVGNRFDRKKGFISRELFDILVAEAK
jgi:MoaA/NifB/PqqE/SkfB family radical SAM enzyme